mmetsp:Transcript_5129/g.7839  ORF Transcript_5129/g.7839 Transcript_5129/m.7839 type:complete len:114 (+) Transcript_5129:1278-1619(+)
MDDYEVRYKRNKSIYKDRSAPQLTIMGNNKQYPDVKFVPESEKPLGSLAAGKLSQNESIKTMIQNRRARVDRFQRQDLKTYFSAEDRTRAFAAGTEKGKPQEEETGQGDLEQI